MHEPDVSDVRAAYPEWQIWTDSAGSWHARLTTSEKQAQPRLAACSLAELAEMLNQYLAGGR